MSPGRCCPGGPPPCRGQGGAVQHQRCLAGPLPGAGWRRRKASPRERDCPPGPRCPLGNGKGQHRVVGGARVGDRRLSPPGRRWSPCPTATVAAGPVGPVGPWGPGGTNLSLGTGSPRGSGKPLRPGGPNLTLGAGGPRRPGKSLEARWARSLPGDQWRPSLREALGARWAPISSLGTGGPPSPREAPGVRWDQSLPVDQWPPWPREAPVAL